MAGITVLIPRVPSGGKQRSLPAFSIWRGEDLVVSKDEPRFLIRLKDRAAELSIALLCATIVMTYGHRASLE